MATRKFKFHEQKLLKKVNFMEYRKENNVREIKILRKYHIQKREDYTKYASGSLLVLCQLSCSNLFFFALPCSLDLDRYNKLCGSIKKVTEMISKLDVKDPFRREITETLLEKLYVCLGGATSNEIP
jgi:U3 small nucleolar ribonucleoprotein protein IMP3